MRPVPQGPRSVVLMLGWRCNASCIHCCWTFLKRGWPSKHAYWQTELTEHDVSCIVGRYETLRDVTLCGFGEPMLHPEFRKIASTVLLRVGVLSMTTNGALLHKYPQIASSPGTLVVSLDSTDAATYESIRPGLSFQVVWRNMREAVAYVSRHSQRALIVNMAVIRRNAGQIYESARRLHELGFHQLSLLRGVVLDALGVVQDHKPYPELLAPDDPSVAEQMSRARSDFPGFTINDFFTSLDGPCKTPAGEYCALPWTTMDITTDGRAHPCCRAYGLDLGHHLTDPWNGEKMTRLRGQLASFSVDPGEFPACAVCSLRGKEASI